MPIGKVWIYRLLFVCVCVCTVTDFSGEDKASLAASNFARWFVSVPILGNFAPLEAQNRTNWPATGKYCLGCISLFYHKRHATDAPFVEYRVACGRRSACVDIGQSPTDELVKHSPGVVVCLLDAVYITIC